MDLNNYLFIINNIDMDSTRIFIFFSNLIALFNFLYYLGIYIIFILSHTQENHIMYIHLTGNNENKSIKVLLHVSELKLSHF